MNTSLSKLEKRCSIFSDWMLSLLEANSGTGNLALGTGRFSLRCEVLAPSGLFLEMAIQFT
jgi:hypothetical protein